MVKFRINTIFSKMLFCLTHCICLKKKMRSCLDEEEKNYTDISLDSRHPIFDLEEGDL